MRKDARLVKTEEPEGLPALLGKMADDLTGLFDAKLTLLKIELREDIEAYIRGLAMVLIGSVMGLVGLALLNVAVAFAISTLFENTNLSEPVRYALGFALTALVYLALGGALIVINKNKLAARGIVPTRTVNELTKDLARIEKEI